MHSEPSYHKDSSLGSFFTGTVVGAVLALTLGTEEGRKFAKNLTKTVKYLSDELGKQAVNLPETSDTLRHQAQDKFSDFSQSVQELNSTIQQTGQQVMNRLYRQPDKETGNFTKDGQPLR